MSSRLLNSVYCSVTSVDVHLEKSQSDRSMKTGAPEEPHNKLETERAVRVLGQNCESSRIHEYHQSEGNIKGCLRQEW